MPELPEVETTVRDLRKKVLRRTFVDVWTDWGKTIRKPQNFEQFKQELKGEMIKSVRRRGKNILFELASGKTLLIHQKLTGHLLFGKWVLKKGKWVSVKNGPLLEDPKNQFLHLIFWFDNGQMLALSDLRKFAKVELFSQKELKKELNLLGPEPLEKSFTFKKFKAIFPKKGKIKQVLMNQNVIAGIGNIYSDEILWNAKIHPLRDVAGLNENEIKRIFYALKEILIKSIELGGESISDFRRPSGERGDFDEYRKIYQREGEKCGRCATVVKRVKLGGRSAHFCPKCQRLT